MRWGIGLVVVVLLAGCTAAPPSLEAGPTPTPTGTGLGPVGTVMATGSFDPAEGVTGTVELVVGSGGFTHIRVTGFNSTLPAEAELILSPFPLTAERTCLDGFAIGLGAVPSDGDLQSIDLSKFGGDDPSFLDGAVMAMRVESDVTAHDGGRTILARAPFTWSIPDLRPGLFVVDSGPTNGAEGDVTLGEDGDPAEYTVASGDVYSAIADRFGISVDDLDYLNPFRQADGAIADEVLNLDRDNRNGPEYLG